MGITKETYHLRAESGLCTRCGKTLDRVTGTVCTSCSQKRLIHYRNKYYKRKNNGCCVRCGKIKGSCNCQQIFNKKQQLKRTERFNKGLCIYCGKNPLTGKSRYCFDNCYFEEMSRSACGNNSLAEALKSMLIKQNFRCIYTDKELVPGDNASVDHIVPKSKGGNDLIENLQWIDKDINTIKNNLTHEEFLELIEKILAKFNVLV